MQYQWPSSPILGVSFQLELKCGESLDEAGSAFRSRQPVIGRRNGLAKIAGRE